MSILRWRFHVFLWGSQSNPGEKNSKHITTSAFLLTVSLVLRPNLPKFQHKITLHVNFKTSSYREKFILQQPKSNPNAYFYFFTLPKSNNLCRATADTQLSQWTYYRQLLFIYGPKTIFTEGNAGYTKRNKNQDFPPRPSPEKFPLERPPLWQSLRKNHQSDIYICKSHLTRKQLTNIPQLTTGAGALLEKPTNYKNKLIST